MNYFFIIIIAWRLLPIGRGVGEREKFGVVLDGFSEADDGVSLVLFE